MQVQNLDTVALNSFASSSKFNVEQIKEVIHLYEEKIINQYIVAHNIILDLSSRWKTRQNQGIQKLDYYKRIYASRSESCNVSDADTTDYKLLERKFNEIYLRLDKLEKYYNLNNYNIFDDLSEYDTIEKSCNNIIDDFLDKITTISENTIVSENTTVYDHDELTEKM